MSIDSIEQLLVTHEQLELLRPILRDLSSAGKWRLLPYPHYSTAYAVARDVAILKKAIERRSIRPWQIRTSGILAVVHSTRAGARAKQDSTTRFGRLAVLRKYDLTDTDIALLQNMALSPNAVYADAVRLYEVLRTKRLVERARWLITTFIAGAASAAAIARLVFCQ